MKIVQPGFALCLAVLPVACFLPGGSEVSRSDGESDAPTAEAASAIVEGPCFTKHVTFEDTLPPFSSGYGYSPSGSMGSGQYRLTTDARNCNAGFRGRAPDGGKFACYDGSTSMYVDAACVTVGVEAGITYKASVLGRSLGTANVPSIQIVVNGAFCGAPNGLAYNVDELAWETTSCEFTRPLSGPVTVCVRDLVTTGWGNDFALDDLRILPVEDAQPDGCDDLECTHRSCDGAGACIRVDNVLCDGHK